MGANPGELAGGLKASLARAKEMDPTLVGMGQTTIRKHVTWITQVLAHAGGEGGGRHKPATLLDFTELRKGLGKGDKRKRSRDKRAAWTKEEIARLLSAPIWTGSASIDDRFNPGNGVWHAAWYWLPLMFILYGGRSAELTALPLADVVEGATIPYSRINYSNLRALKNPQSVRSLPIHPELIRLGFLDYVVALRSAGHALLFPEIHSLNSKSFASTFYKSIFKPWRSWGFPDGQAGATGSAEAGRTRTFTASVARLQTS